LTATRLPKISLFTWVDSFTLVTLRYGETIDRVSGGRQIKINKVIAKQITCDECQVRTTSGQSCTTNRTTIYVVMHGGETQEDEDYNHWESTDTVADDHEVKENYAIDEETEGKRKRTKIIIIGKRRTTMKAKKIMQSKMRQRITQKRKNPCLKTAKISMKMIRIITVDIREIRSPELWMHTYQRHK
jgi:hypothetical protein